MVMEKWTVGDVLTTLANMWTQILGALLLIIMYMLGLFHSTQNKKHMHCDSPDCVRCRAYTSRSMEVLRNEWFEYENLIPGGERKKFRRISHTMRQYKSPEKFDKQSTFQILDLPTKSYHSREFFESDVKLLEGCLRDIHSEFLEIESLPEDDGSWKVNSTPSGEWSAFYLVNQGVEIERNTYRCPKTYNVLKQLENLMTNCIFGNACFSVLQPGTHIPEHYGPCNIRVRCHLGVDVPEGCEIFVNNERRRWTQGRCLLFDDSYLHSVTYHETDGANRPRVVFLVDFWNPELSSDEINGLRFLLDSNKIKM